MYSKREKARPQVTFGSIVLMILEQRSHKKHVGLRRALARVFFKEGDDRERGERDMQRQLRLLQI